MSMLITAAARPLIDLHVTGFVSVGAALVIYGGSALWFLALVGVDAYNLSTNPPESTVWGMLLGANSIMFALQTINVLYTQFLFWPLVSAYYSLQLWCIGLRGAVLSVHMDDPWPYALMLFAQTLFTSSQLSVTLEYLYRASAKRPDPPQMPPPVRIPRVAYGPFPARV